MTTASTSARYSSERPFLESALDQWLVDLRQLAKSVDPNSFVDGRVKTYRSVLGKIRKDPSNIRDWSTLGDLVALKAIFPTVEGVEKFTEILLAQVDWKPELEDRKAQADRLEYAAKQFDLERDDVVDSQGEAIKTEVQVRTAAVDAWYVVDHRLRYKGIVQLPEALERKVLRLTVLQDLFDEEVKAIFDAQATIAEYTIARAYEFLTRKIDEITGGLASASRPDALLEALLRAYPEGDAENLQAIIEGFLLEHYDVVQSVVHDHQYESDSFVEDRDWLYSEPEVLIIAERSVARPELLKDSLKHSDYERVVARMAESFRHEIGSPNLPT